jgi:AraC-like DNA-binding protein
MQPHPRIIKPSPHLADIVEAMWEWDIVDSAVARSAVGKLLPSLAPQLAIHYRSRMWSDRVGGDGQFQQIASGIQTKVVTVRATGPVGAIMVRLKPEAAPWLIRSSLHELCDSQVELSDLFPGGAIQRLTTQLAEARNTARRVSLVEAFLSNRIRDGALNTPEYAAALRLRSNFTVPIGKLAAEVQLSERQLSRRFRATYGIAPKRFARVARLTSVLRLRQTGSSWLDIVAHCGYTDQAHLINDFDDLVHHAPAEFFRMISSTDVRAVNSTLSRAALSNTFLI